MSITAFVKLAYGYFEQPFVILLAIPLVLIALWLLKKEFIKLKEDPDVVKQKKRARKIMALTRTLIIILLCIALASPYVQHEKIIEGDPYIKLLIDNSTSMELFEPVEPRLSAALEKKLNVETKTIATGERSELGDAILNNLEPAQSVLLVTDGNSNFGANLGDVALFATKLNATINAIRLAPKETDVGVAILGPSKTMADVENTFTIVINRVGKKDPVHLVVTLDGATLIDETTADPVKEITQKLPEGYHKLVAKIDAKDYFPQNNIFYKTVKVVPKPRILFVSEKESPLKTLLSQLYVVDSLSTVPSNLKDYYAIAINDLNADKLKEASDRINEFVSDGNGMVVIGGKNSFDNGNYKDSVFETMLPVFVSTPGKKPGEISVVIVMDISGSTGAPFGRFTSTAEFEKSAAIGIYRDLRLDIRLAVVAFNTQAYLISEPSYVYEKVGLDDRIGRLKFGGGTLIQAGLLKAIAMLSQMGGSKNIILMSDGKTQSESAAIEAAKLAANEGIRIYTVGVGPTTNENLMIQIAEIGNGIYFRATEETKLKIIFGDVEDQKQKGGTMGLVVLNANHFITEGYEPKADIHGFNQVVPKTTARLLLTTTTGEPILTVWRVGLGRVAAWSTDDGREWAGDVLSKKNSKIYARMFNWAIGDPDRKAESFIDAKDTIVNEPTEITIKSETPPEAKGVTFYKIDEDLYSAAMTPTTTGFHEVSGAVFAANYAREYGGLGFNEELAKIVASTGGKIFDPGDIDGIVEHTKAKAKRIVNTKDRLGWPFVLAAVLIFLVEIFIRRLVRRE
ncbi:MAG: VWA domain-containing protein [Candidatus Woesearchaeota archaeon]